MNSELFSSGTSELGLTSTTNNKSFPRIKYRTPKTEKYKIFHYSVYPSLRQIMDAVSPNGNFRIFASTTDSAIERKITNELEWSKFLTSCQNCTSIKLLIEKVDFPEDSNANAPLQISASAEEVCESLENNDSLKKELVKEAFDIYQSSFSKEMLLKLKTEFPTVTEDILMKAAALFFSKKLNTSENIVWIDEDTTEIPDFESLYDAKKLSESRSLGKSLFE